MPPPEGEDKPEIDAAKEAEMRIQSNTARTQQEDAKKFLVDTCAKMDWQAPEQMPAKPADSPVNLADSETSPSGNNEDKPKVQDENQPPVDQNNEEGK